MFIHLNKLTSIILFALFIINVSCERFASSPSHINLEQKGNENAENILVPGHGYIGIIHDQSVNLFYYNTSKYSWQHDRVTQLILPDAIDGVIALGMGYMGVLDDNVVQFYYIDAQNQWRKDENMLLVLPEDYDRLLIMKMKYDIGIIGVECDSMIDFYSLDDGRWQLADASTFHIPQGIDEYFAMGNMNMAIVDGHKLGFYYLTDDNEWVFAEDHVLQVPDGYDAFIPFEPGIIGIMEGGVIRFHKIDKESGQWIIDETFNFNWKSLLSELEVEPA